MHILDQTLSNILYKRNPVPESVYPWFTIISVNILVEHNQKMSEKHNKIWCKRTDYPAKELSQFFALNSVILSQILTFSLPLSIRIYDGLPKLFRAYLNWKLCLL